MTSIQTKTPTSAADAERQAERLRNDLAGTLDLLAGNLTPGRLASELVETAKDATPAWLRDYWRLAQGPVGLGIVGATAASVALGLIARRRWR